MIPVIPQSRAATLALLEQVKTTLTISIPQAEQQMAAPKQIIQVDPADGADASDAPGGKLISLPEPDPFDEFVEPLNESLPEPLAEPLAEPLVKPAATP